MNNEIIKDFMDHIKNLRLYVHKVLNQAKVITLLSWFFLSKSMIISQ